MTVQLTNAYKVIYYEVGTAIEFASGVKEATTDNNQQAQILIIGGHGSSKFICFDNTLNPTPTGWEIDPRGFLDMSDLDIANTVKCAVVDYGHVIESSCSNGEYPTGDTPGIDNISEFIHYVLFPNAYSHAAQDDIYDFQIKFNSKGLNGINQVFFYDTALGVYGYGGNSSTGLILSPEPGISCPGLSSDQKILSKLSQNYPNPFSDNTSIPFEASENGKQVVLRFYNSLGQLVKVDIINNAIKGKNTYIWDATYNNSKAVAGMYFCTMEIDGKSAGSIKMIVR
jgi:hypothetical protein